MDYFRVELHPANTLQGDIVVKVLINDSIVTDSDYCLNIDTFFSAIGAQKSQVELIGGCGVPECCATGYLTYSTPYSWKWGDFHLKWADVYQAASQIIAQVEQLSEQKKSYQHFHSSLPFYRQKLDELKKLASFERGLTS